MVMSKDGLVTHSSSRKIKSGFLNFTFVLIISCLFFPMVATAQKLSNGTQVESDKMTVQREQGLIEFKGNVKLTRPDGTLTADTLKLFFDESKGEQGEIKKIMATGKVEFTSDQRRASSDEAVYTTDDQILILTGTAPKLWTGKNFVSGKKITFYRKTNKAVVESDGKTRVNAFFDPNDEETRKFKEKSVSE